MTSTSETDPPSIPIPPPSITQHPKEILDHCERLEMTLGTSLSPPPLLMETQMAILLYLGDTIHAHHLWQRWKRQQQQLDQRQTSSAASTEENQSTTGIMTTFGAICNAMIQRDSITAFSLLLSANPGALLFPADIANAYRARLLFDEWNRVYTQISLSSNDGIMMKRLGFESHQHVLDFIQSYVITTGKPSCWELLREENSVQLVKSKKTMVTPTLEDINKMDQTTSMMRFLDSGTKLNV
eukprot:CAMPEP_0118675574 /NCGR_PEP_ID=MMETSP0800-20121206/1536_1 /TAXON_ID=210618 ORGANISM="Striatella unipunctata, Strain CCMP2910" /NCGR_SAMPLE_ID=MMETSP0800 /ASSEMBLY_ACC=CAM_ASM_000638 /LENGTH=240 /DNA_ID=CAMNT_0006570929 /DNA_START=99 /DNA_END=821 /DNA_ORIENTATION=-